MGADYIETGGRQHVFCPKCRSVLFSIPINAKAPKPSLDSHCRFCNYNFNPSTNTNNVKIRYKNGKKIRIG